MAAVILGAVVLAGAGVGLALRTSTAGHALSHRPAVAPSGRDAVGTKLRVLASQLGPVLSRAHRLGPLVLGTPLRLSLGLRDRNVAALNALLDQGKTVSRAEYDRRFGPDPALVRTTEQWLNSRRIETTWAPGDALLEASGPASAVQSAFSVSLSLYRVKEPGGLPPETFYAPDDQPTLPLSVATEVTSVLGLDDYVVPRTRPQATSSSRCGPVGSPKQVGGFTPSSIAGFYNFTPLYKAGVEGQDQTIVFMELEGYQPSDLQMFAKGFGLPPFNVVGPIVNPKWGAAHPLVESSDACGSETELDLEVVHGLAPQARLVVYEAGLNTSGYLLDDDAIALQSAIDAYPRSVFNLSVVWCEDAASAEQYQGLFTQMEAGGGTPLVSSGDNGAYSRGCPGHELGVQEPEDCPNATSVGGTTAFIGTGSTYGREAAWGEPLEQWGTGGGLSQVFKRPSWQSGPGVSNQYSNGMRQVPDVSAIADGDTPYDVAMGGRWVPSGGTSASAPLWSALVALTDEALAQRHLGEVGFANPALYDFGSHPSHFPAPAFHSVTLGNNLFYQSTSTGWNYGTGWGTPDAAALVDDFIAYSRGAR